MELTSPAGTTITLVDRPGLGTPGNHDCGTRGPDLRTVLRDDADVAVHDYQPGDDATRPEMPLSSFVGQDAGGFWTLTVRDESFAAGGTLESWSLIIDAVPVALAVSDATAAEGEETFFLELRDPVGLATLAVPTGTATIVDDDDEGTTPTTATPATTPPAPPAEPVVAEPTYAA